MTVLRLHQRVRTAPRLLVELATRSSPTREERDRRVGVEGVEGVEAGVPCLQRGLSQPLGHPRRFHPSQSERRWAWRARHCRVGWVRTWCCTMRTTRSSCACCCI